MTQSHAQDQAITNLAHEATMAVLGDTFAIHEVGERIAYTEILPHLVALGEGAPRKRLTLLASVHEVNERFGLVRRPADDDSLVALLPSLESALDTVRGVLSDDEFGWSGCHFTAGLLERDGLGPIEDGELRILISPRGGSLTTPGNAPRLPVGAHHAVSNALAPDGCPAPDTEIAPALAQRSVSRDLLATCGLVSFLRRNPGFVRDLTLDTIKQIEFEFPRLVDEGLFAP